MEHSWGFDYSEEGIVSRQNLYVVNDGAAVKQSSDAPNLAICIPTRGTLPVEVFMAFKRMGMPINVRVVFMYARGEMGTSGRDRMTIKALEMGSDFVAFFDDDVVPPPDVLYKMMMEMQKDASIGLITGVYTTKGTPCHPHIYKAEGQSHYWGFSLSPYDPPEDIWGCGAGCLLVRTDAIRQMKQPYWSEAVEKDAEKQVHILGHDLHFCHKVRAAGYRTVVDGSIQCDHYDSSNHTMYRLPKNSPPVLRYKADSRNDAYWMNWWGVNPGGEGAHYAELMEILSESTLTHNEGAEALILGSGGGAVVQAVMNMRRGPAYLYAATPDEWQMCEATYLPYVSSVEGVFDQLYIIEPELYNWTLEQLQDLALQVGCRELLVVSREPFMFEGHTSEVKGVWNVLEISNFKSVRLASGGSDDGSASEVREQDHG